MTALVIYLMAGSDAPELAEAAVEGGADILELGFPFSDPLAEGPIIRAAAERALAAGMTTPACLDCLSRIRDRVQTPIVPMTYAALPEAYGYDAFDRDVRAAGATSFILVDLPTEEHPLLRRVHLVAPTSSDEHIQLAASRTEGWIYVVALAGTTGIRTEPSSQLASLIGRARRLANDATLYAGFGISTPDQARSAAAIADGVIVGTRAVQMAEAGAQRLQRYVGSLRRAIDSS